jgi:hypothetical protein
MESMPILWPGYFGSNPESGEVLPLRFFASCLENSPSCSGPFREGTCAPRYVAGQVRYLNGFDCRTMLLSRAVVYRDSSCYFVPRNRDHRKSFLVRLASGLNHEKV